MMNGGHIETQMAFIVEQQAKIAVDVDRLYEAQALTEQKLGEANEMITRLAFVTREGFKDVNAKINALVDSHVAWEDLQKRKEAELDIKLNAIADSHREFQESQKAFRESQKLTDESVRRLSATVDRFLSNRRNGD